MKKLLPTILLFNVFLFAGCGFVRELGPSVREGFEQAGPPPIEKTGSPPLDFVAIGSYLLNVGLGTWAAYERRQRRKKES